MAKDRNKKSRRGAAAVEFALCAPILFLFTFTGIEFARINMIRNTIESAAYQGARSGVLPGAEAGDCQTVSEELLDIVGITGYTVNVSPILPGSDNVTVTVQTPITILHGYVTPRYYLGKTLTASVTLPREKG